MYNKLIELASAQLCSGRRLVFFYHTEIASFTSAQTDTTNETDDNFLESLKHGVTGFQLVNLSLSEFKKGKRRRYMVTL